MSLLNIIRGYFSLNDPWYLFLLFGQIAAIVGLFWILRYVKPKWSKVGYLILFVWLVRCLLFGNQLSWGFYYQQIVVDDVGWRQQSAVNVEYHKFFKYPGKKYLAAGSSQTYVMYFDHSKVHHDITIFNLAGMTPIDFYLYRKYIAARKPEYLLLYLSEFDMAKEPSLTGAKIAPPQGLGFLRELPVYWGISKEAHTEMDLKEMAVMELFPEYKYAFIFKGLLQKFMKKNESLGIQSLYEKLHPDSGNLKKEIAGTLDEMDERWLKYQVHFLREFLEYCSGKPFKVVIVEGQYNPLVRNGSTARLKDLTRIEIDKLVKAFDNVVYVPTSEALPLLESDFDDSVHVKPEPAQQYVPKLLDKISSAGAIKSDPK
jgi:hypothetical protein